MTNEQIEALLKEKIGLKKDSISSRQMAKALENRRLACHMPDLASYLQFLQTSSQEWWELIDQIVVPETWFFRHREAFRFLQTYVKTEWLKKPSFPVLKILSLPCSTGEEPYSIAITLLESGLTPQQFKIDAIDISQRALEKAKKAVYGEYSFREDYFIEKSRYFHPTSASYQLQPFVRETVQFKQGNLLDLKLSTHKYYHIIFCRHLLIYLDLSARSRAIDVLEQLLAPNGLIFVGSPEISLLKPPRFKLINYPSAFVYQKNSSPYQAINKKNNQFNQPSSRSKLDTQNRLKNAKKINNQPLTHHDDSSGDKQQPLINNTLLEAQHLADSGLLDEAESLGQIYLAQAPSDPQVYLLLGQVYQAKGDDLQAEQYFQKVVYLEPNSEEALIHLALIKESRGDFNGATLIRQRIQRVLKMRDKL